MEALISLHVGPKHYEYNVQMGGLCLRHIDFQDGTKANDAWILRDGYTELADYRSAEFGPLFIALHNYKIQNGKK